MTTRLNLPVRRTRRLWFAAVLTSLVVAVAAFGGKTTYHEAVSEVILLEEGYSPYLEEARARWGNDRADDLREIFVSFGDLPMFRGIVMDHGLHAALVVEEHVREGNALLTGAQRLGEVMDGLLRSGEDVIGGMPSAPQFSFEELTPYQWGLLAIAVTAEKGHTFLGQYAVDGNLGRAKRVYTDSAVLLTADVLLGGISSFERKFAQGDELRSADYAWAALDAALIVAGVTAARSLHVAHGATKAAMLTGKAAKAGKTVYSFGALAKGVVKTAGKAAVLVGSGYLLLHHPNVVDAFFGATAEVLGASPLVGRLVGWGALAVAAWWLLAPLVFMIWWPIRGFRATLRIMSRH